VQQIGVSDSASTLKLYKTNWNELGNADNINDFFSKFSNDVGENYYHDFFVEVNKKFSQKWKGTFMYANQFYNRNMVQFGSPNAGYQNIFSNIFVVDLTWKYSSNSALRFETQGFLTDNRSNPNAGSWVTAILEWSPNTNFFIALIDQYNYGNPDPNLQLHYALITGGYTTGAHRISMSYGKQRAGIFCVGGVCRNVPASNGVAISITSSF
jgi:hypothetical protein